jgi:hypothetical protein
MFAVVIALFFASAAVFAVLSIARTFAGAADRLDALFTEYRAADQGREVRGRMRPVKQFTAAIAPDYAPRTVVLMPMRSGGNIRISQPSWRAAA